MDASVDHVDRGVAQGRKVGIVRRQDDRGAGLGLRPDGREHHGGRVGVELSRRLIRHDDRRCGGQRPRHRDALPLTAGQLLGQPIRDVRQGRSREGRLGSRPHLGAVQPAQLQGQLDVLGGRQHRQEPIALEHDRRVVGPFARIDGSRIRLDEPGDHPQEGRLARPGRSGDREDPAGSEIEVDPVDHGPAPADHHDAAQPNRDASPWKRRRHAGQVGAH